MEQGYLILRCDSDSWKGVRIHVSFNSTRPLSITSWPIFVVRDKSEAIKDCRRLNHQYKGVFVHYYYPISLYGFVSENHFKFSQL